MARYLFTVSNHHTAAGGTPPRVDGDRRGTYCGYFSNEYGEQAIYEYDWETGAATLRMGDAGWDRVHRLVEGAIEGLKLGKAEAMWVRACWLATGAIGGGTANRGAKT